MFSCVLLAVLQHFTDESYEQNKTLFGKWIPRTENSHLCIFSGISAATMKSDQNAPVAVIALLDDIQSHRSDKYENEWNGLWQFSNIMQFDPSYIAVSQAGLDSGVYLALPVQTVFNENEVDTNTQNRDLWSEVYELLFEDEVIKFAKQLSKAGTPVPDEVGYEITGDDGKVIAMAELAWTERRIAFLTEDQKLDADVLRELGWTVFDLASDVKLIDFGGNQV